MSNITMMTLKNENIIVTDSGEKVTLTGDYVLVSRAQFDSITDDAISWLESNRPSFKIKTEN